MWQRGRWIWQVKSLASGRAMGQVQGPSETWPLEWLQPAGELMLEAAEGSHLTEEKLKKQLMELKGMPGFTDMVKRRASS